MPNKFKILYLAALNPPDGNCAEIADNLLISLWRFACTKLDVLRLHILQEEINNFIGRYGVKYKHGQ